MYAIVNASRRGNFGDLGNCWKATVNEHSTGRSVLMPHLWSSHRSVALGKTF